MGNETINGISYVCRRRAPSCYSSAICTLLFILWTVLPKMLFRKQRIKHLFLLSDPCPQLSSYHVFVCLFLLWASHHQCYSCCRISLIYFILSVFFMLCHIMAIIHFMLDSQKINTSNFLDWQYHGLFRLCNVILTCKIFPWNTHTQKWILQLSLII